jgi:hypothetical protein
MPTLWEIISPAVQKVVNSAGARTRAVAQPRAALIAAGVLCGLCASDPAAAHGFAGKRFFPATLTNEDPFVADELSLPTLSSRKLPAGDEGPAMRETAASVELAKRITPELGIGLGATYLRLQPEDGERRSGFDNLEASLKYQFYKSDEHEAIVSVGIDWDIAHTGSHRVDPEPFSTYTPTLFFGKGFGDLPDGANYLRPFALTGQVGVGIPSRSSTTFVNELGDTEVERNPRVLKWGFALEYNLQYLQSNVKDVGLEAPFNRLIPLVEFAYEKPLSGPGGTTGTINPGFLWAGHSVQFGFEAVIPVNDRTGNKTGFIAQLHFFLDDIFPNSIGRPLFGNP